MGSQLNYVQADLHSAVSSLWDAALVERWLSGAASTPSSNGTGLLIFAVESLPSWDESPEPSMRTYRDVKELAFINAWDSIGIREEATSLTRWIFARRGAVELLHDEIEKMIHQQDPVGLVWYEVLTP